jgi:hypothetical protein
LEVGSGIPTGILIVALFAIADLAFGPLTSLVNPGNNGVFLLFMIFAVIMVQFPLFAAWIVLAPVELPRRIAVALATAGAWFFAWTLGMLLLSLLERYAIELAEMIWSLFFCLPLVLLAVQIPLWVARVWFGWRIVDLNRAGNGPPREHFHLRHFFVATGVVALAFALARLGNTRDVESTEEFMLAMVILAIVCGLISTCTLLPLLVATLRGRRVWLYIPFTIGLLWILLSVAFMVLSAFAPTGMSRGELFAVHVMFLTYVGLLAGIFYLARLCGYRLAWGRAG